MLLLNMFIMFAISSLDSYFLMGTDWYAGDILMGSYIFVFELVLVQVLVFFVLRRREQNRQANGVSGSAVE